MCYVFPASIFAATNSLLLNGSKLSPDGEKVKTIYRFINKEKKLVVEFDDLYIENNILQKLDKDKILYNDIIFDLLEIYYR